MHMSESFVCCLLPASRFRLVVFWNFFGRIFRFSLTYFFLMYRFAFSVSWSWWTCTAWKYPLTISLQDFYSCMSWPLANVILIVLFLTFFQSFALVQVYWLNSKNALWKLRKFWFRIIRSLNPMKSRINLQWMRPFPVNIIGNYWHVHQENHKLAL